MTPGTQFVLGHADEPREARIGEAAALQCPQPRKIEGCDALGFGTGLLVDEFGDLRQEPRVDAGELMHPIESPPGAQRIGHLQQAIRARHPQILCETRRAVFAERQRGHRREPIEPGLEAAQRLLQRLLEGTADGHHLAHRFHLRGQTVVRALELLEGEAGNLGDHIVDSRLKRGRGRAAGDVVAQFIERVADRELGRDLGDREPGRLRGERRGTRDARVHLDDDQSAVFRIDGELYVGAAGVDADLAQHRDRCIAHPLVLAVGEGLRRRDGDGVAGVHAHRIEVLDGADDDAVVRPVAHDLHLEFLPTEHGLLDQHLVGGRGIEAACDDGLELLAVVGDAAARAAEREGRADDAGETKRHLDRERVLEAARHRSARRLETDLAHRIAEQFAVLGHIDGLARGADHLDAEPFEHALADEIKRGVERRLPAHRRQ